MIKEGTKVTVNFAAHETGRAYAEPATVIHTPKGAGDLWQVEYEDGSIEAINPYHFEFVGFVVKKEDLDETIKA